MKKMIALLSLLVLSNGAPARAGWDSGNAGDAFAAEFLFSGRDILHRLEMLASKGISTLPVDRLRSAMEGATVVSEEKVYHEGLERDAVSYPSQRLVKVSRTRWRDLRRASETKARLTVVLHEFLWLSGIDDTNFRQSGQVIDSLAIPPYNPGIWLYVPGQAFAVAECTGRLADGSFVTVTVNTKGVTRAPDQGEVKIEKEGNTYGYRFAAEEIAQFFENDDAEGGTAAVGLGAYVGREFPLSVKYFGTNYVDMDLKVVLESGVKNEHRNFMQVWQGPGHPAEDQFRLDNPVCSVSSNN